MRPLVIVIGGGASGMAAAIAAARGGASVTILEKKEQNGKKILISGNGHCNYSNTDLSVSHYYTSDPERLSAFLESFPTSRLLSFFREIGLFSEERGGGLYPASFQAASVNSALLGALKQLGVQILNHENVQEIRQEEQGFLVRTDHTSYSAEKVILSMGSAAGVRDPRPFNGYEILKKLSFKLSPVYPALVRLQGDNGPEAFWDGVRVYGSAAYEGKSCSGELQLRKDGISGVAVFQLAHAVNETLLLGKKPAVRLCFMKDPDREAFLSFLRDAGKKELTKDTPFSALIPGSIPKKLSVALFRERPYFHKLMKEMEEAELLDAISLLYDYTYPVTSSAPIEEAQVAAGGVPLSEVSDFFEALRIPGLFITGELLNVDGETGGYNLHFAFASGLAAGERAGKR